MTALPQALADYLTMRRRLGYKLERAGKLLAQFICYLSDVGADTVTVERALAWASLPAGRDPSWWSYRLSVVRGFAAYLHTLDPATEVPAAELLPWRPQRATPYLYSDEEIAALIAAAYTLRFPLRVATYQTLIGLLFISPAGTRLLYSNVHSTFRQLRRRAGLQPRSASCRPRIHDLRHTFAIRTVLDAYRADADVQARLPLLSTYLGHVDPGATYWYLSAAPELLALAGQRLERHLRGGR